MPSFLEPIAIILALLYVFWAARGSLLCWPAAIISSAIYCYLCYEVKLYPETLLQFFYLVFGIYGWMKWKTSSNSGTVTYRKILPKQLLILLGSGLIITLPVAWFFDNYTDTALPWMDAPIMVFSLMATWMVAQKFLENWYFWILIDLAAAALYEMRDMKLTALLYLFYVAMAVWGLKKWKEQTK